MPIQVVNYKKTNSEEKPVQYVGVLVSAHPHILGVFNLRMALNKDPAEYMRIFAYDSKRNAVVQKLCQYAADHNLTDDVEIHLIESHKTVENLFNLKKGENPAVENVHTFFTNILKENYTISRGESLRILSLDDSLTELLKIMLQAKQFGVGLGELFDQTNTPVDAKPTPGSNTTSAIRSLLRINSVPSIETPEVKSNIEVASPKKTEDIRAPVAKNDNQQSAESNPRRFKK